MAKKKKFDNNLEKHNGFFNKDKKNKFKIHFMTFVILSVFLFIIDFITSPDHFWFYWAVLGWGIGISIQAIKVYLKN